MKFPDLIICLVFLEGTKCEKENGEKKWKEKIKSRFKLNKLFLPAYSSLLTFLYTS